jgi:3-phosphoshikimate 1-carboxyvinyltransferase
VGLVSVRGPDRLEACEVPPAWVPRLIDEIPAWAVAASAARGTSRLTGAAELRVKESDRIAALARNLNALGVAARELADGLEITGGPVRGGAVDAARDHRIAIASAMLGLRAREPVTVADASVIETSFPGFGAVLEAAGGRVERGGGPDA